MASNVTPPQASTFLEGVTIVFRGNFNPAIVSPSWLLHQELIGQDDFDGQTIEMINSAIAIFSTGWLTCHVTADRLQLGVLEAEDFERLRDLAVGVLNTLSHTPISSMGINRDIHLQIRNEIVWHAIGDFLVPKEFWAERLTLPGMRSMAVEGVRSDGFGGGIVVQVEPSVRVVPGIYLAHNDHYTLGKEESPVTERRSLNAAAQSAEHEYLMANSSKLRLAVTILNDHWKDSMSRATLTFNKMKKLAGDLS